MAKKNNRNNKVDIVIPAYKARSSILRTLSSIATQTILEDLEVIIVNDCDPEGDYQDFVDMFSPFYSIKEIKMEKNGGPGLARQFGYDNGTSEFVTFIDGDDTFASAIALETLRTAISESDSIKMVSSTFLQLGEDLQHILPHQQDMTWMFGKIYRREFLDRYKVRFNETRANEDSGFNTICRLLCDNPNEQIRFIQEVTYYWHNKENSITRINDGQYGFDQCFCGWTDNMIYAIQHVKRIRPFSGSVTQWIVSVIFELYYYYVECYAKGKVFAEQDWEYVKKFYNTCYKKIEDDIPEEAFSEMFSVASTQKWGSGRLLGVVPHIGISEYMEKLRTEEYDPDHIYEVWAKMKKDPETRELIKNNETCGVCPVGYTNKPKVKDETEESEAEEKRGSKKNK